MLTQSQQDFLKSKGFSYNTKDGEWVRERNKLIIKISPSTEYNKKEKPFMVYTYNYDFCYYDDGQEYEENWEYYSSFQDMVFDQCIAEKEDLLVLTHCN